MKKKKKRLSRGVQLHNTVSQSPLVFPPGLKKERYTVDEDDGEVEIRKPGLDLVNTEGFNGKVIEMNNGTYCAGFNLKKVFARLPFDEALVWDEDLPTKFDYKVLFNLIEISKGKRTIRFSSKHALLKRLGLEPGAEEYKRVRKCLAKWSFMMLHYVGTYTWGKKNEKSSIEVETFGIIQSFRFGEDGVKVSFDVPFNELLKGTYTTLLDSDIIDKLKGEAAINIYQYLSSYNLMMRDGSKLTRDVFEFSRIMLSRKDKYARLKQQINGAIGDINKSMENTRSDWTYQVEFNDDSKTVSFIRNTVPKQNILPRNDSKVELARLHI